MLLLILILGHCQFLPFVILIVSSLSHQVPRSVLTVLIIDPICDLLAVAISAVKVTKPKG